MREAIEKLMSENERRINRLAASPTMGDQMFESGRELEMFQQNIKLQAILDAEE